jgi:hypothetical protein
MEKQRRETKSRRTVRSKKLTCGSSRGRVPLKSGGRGEKDEDERREGGNENSKSGWQYPVCNRADEEQVVLSVKRKASKGKKTKNH